MNPPLNASAAADSRPLSASRSRAAFEALAGEGRPHVNVSAVRVRDVKTFGWPFLEPAVTELVARTPRLRTHVEFTEGGRTREVTQAGGTAGEVAVRTLGAGGDFPDLAAFARAERERGLDWSAPSWLRVTALRDLAEPDTWWLATTWSGVLLSGAEHRRVTDELVALCTAAASGDPLPAVAGPPAATDADTVDADTVVAADTTADTTARPDRAPALPPALSLPAAWGRWDADAADWHTTALDLGHLADGLGALAERAGTGLGSVLHTVHLRVMTMLTHESSFTTGVASGPDSPVRAAAFDADAPVTDWTALVRTVAGVERSATVPACPPGAGDASRTPVEIAFRHETRVTAPRFPVDDSFELAPEGFGLGVRAVSGPGSVVLRLTGAARAATPGALDQLAALYRAVAAAMAADPAGAADADLLPDAERDLVVRAWNDTAAEYRRDLCVHELFERAVRRDPEAVAVNAADGTTVTYGELNARANQLAHHLRDLGVGADTFVGICVEHSVEMLVGLLGILKSGGAYVPLDPEHPADRLACIVEDTSAPVVVTVSGLTGALPPSDAVTVLLDRDAGLLAGRPVTDPEPLAHPDNLIYAMFTSGSTGRPKGVLVHHRGVVNYLDWAVEGYGLPVGSHGAPMLGSIAFDLSVPNFFLPLIGGKDVTLLPTDRALDELAERLVRPGDFSLLKITPAHLDVLRSQIPEPGSVTSVHTFVVGADEVKPETVAAWQRIAPGARIINEYGPTETVVGCSVYEAGPDFDPAAPVPIGRPIANMQMYVLDRFLNPVPIGAVGELFMGGDGVTRGYLHRPELTAEKFLPDPFHPVPGSRMYRTGDLARFRPDGDIDFLGRIDHQVKIRGYRIELGEIEARLLLHPGVSEAVVAARTDAHGDKCLAAYVVGVAGRAPDAAELRSFLAEALPGYMVPAEFVHLPALPLSTAGKVDRRLLPDPVRDTVEEHRDAPASPTEHLLATAWAEALGVDAVRTGDALVARAGLDGTLRMVERARAAGLDVPRAAAFRHPGVTALARALDEARTAEAAGDAAREVPFTPAQRHLMGRPGGAGHSSVLLRFPAALRTDAVREALRGLTGRHEALRLRRDGERQVLGPAGSGWSLAQVTAPAADTESLRKAAAAEADTALPAEGPALRAVLVSPATEPGRASWLLLSAPRQVVDTASWAVLVSDLASALGDPDAEAPEPAGAGFADWSDLLVRRANGEEITGQLATWLTPGPAARFPEEPPAADAGGALPPTGEPGGGQPGNTPGGDPLTPVAARTLVFDPALTRELLSGGGDDADAVLLTALARTLADWDTASGHGLTVELATPGRATVLDGLDPARTVGCLTARFPLTLPTAGAAGATPAAVRAALDAVPDAGLGHGLLRHLRTDRVAAVLAATPSPAVAYDACAPLDARTQGPAEPGGVLRYDLPDAPAESRPLGHAVAVTRRLRADRLEVLWQLDATRWSAGTLDRLTARFESELRTLTAPGTSAVASG
ncbi:amino acid adenylation domain-containing protein [Streptomyces racemochromogenes]|uniref:Amino acid adenylation domain-containing protein n=1 Tax=Streptomyces racemochromogenes TaxID=67353 RepID=A0ABW7PGE3_9ACTN